MEYEMSVLDHETMEMGIRSGQSSWPADAQAAMSKLETSFAPLTEHRAAERRRYRTTARFWIAAEQSTQFYVRDVSARGLGFICKDALTESLRGKLRLALPDGGMMQVTGTILRCREFAPGWYEGALQFAREQGVFS
jgi:hypothetical protein